MWPCGSIGYLVSGGSPYCRADNMPNTSCRFASGVFVAYGRCSTGGWASSFVLRVLLVDCSLFARCVAVAYPPPTLRVFFLAFAVLKTSPCRYLTVRYTYMMAHTAMPLTQKTGWPHRVSDAAVGNPFGGQQQVHSARDGSPVPREVWCFFFKIWVGFFAQPSCLNLQHRHVPGKPSVCPLHGHCCGHRAFWARNGSIVYHGEMSS